MTDGGQSLILSSELGQLSVQIVAVTVITNGFSHLTSLPRRYVGFVMSFAVFTALNFSQIEFSAASMIALIANVFIVYSSAVGVSEMAAATGSGGRTEEVTRGRIFRSWW